MAKWLLIVAWSVTMVLAVMVLRLDGPYMLKIASCLASSAFPPAHKLTYNETPCFDQDLVKLNKLYPVCYKLEQAEAIYCSKPVSPSAERAYYQDLMSAGKLNCGKVRRSKPFFRSKTKQAYKMWTDGCVKEIPDAKMRLREFLRVLCDDQRAANVAYQGRIHRGADVDGGCASGSTVDSSNGAQKDDVCTNTNTTTPTVGPTNTTSTTPTTPTTPTTTTTNTAPTYGIIYTGEPKHFRLIHQSITSLILSNSTLSVHTVEVWVNYYAHTECMRVFSKFEMVRCMVFRGSSVQSGSVGCTTHSGNGTTNAADTHTNTANTANTTSSTNTNVIVRGFESKLHALLQTTLHHVLFLDADNVVSRDVTEVFRNPGYVRTGALLWPDLWGAACADTSYSRSGHTASSGFVLYAAQFPGLSVGTHSVYGECSVCSKCSGSGSTGGCDGSTNTCTGNTDTTNAATRENVWRNQRQYVQESETGQIVLNLTKHRSLIRLALHMIQDTAFFKRIFNGDKDIFRFMFLISGVPFHFNSVLPGVSVMGGMKKDSIVHFHDIGSSVGGVNVNGDCDSSVSGGTCDSSVSGGTSGAGVCDNLASDTNATTNTAINTTTSHLPLFFHQLKRRDPYSFNRYLLPPPIAHTLPSYCISTNTRITGNSSGLLLHTGGVELVKYAKLLFETADYEWSLLD